MAVLPGRKLPSRNDLRWFGVVVAAFFGIWSGVFWWAGASVAPRVLAAGGLGLVTLYYAIPQLRLPLYLSWMRLVHPIGWFVTHLILALIFFGLITPLGMVQRLFGRDALRMRRGASEDSYWTPRDSRDDTASYFRQT